MKPKPKFADFVEIGAFDTLKEPRYPTQKVLEYLFFKIKTVCSKCHSYKTFKLIRHKQKGDCFTIMCRCKCIIIYPESDKRDNCRLWVEIDYDEYKGLNHGHNRENRNMAS